jgi:hypothetical protein
VSGGNPSGRGGRPVQSLGSLPRSSTVFKEEDRLEDKLEPPKKRLKKDKMNKKNSLRTQSPPHETNGSNGDLTLRTKQKRKLTKHDQELVRSKGQKYD